MSQTLIHDTKYFASNNMMINTNTNDNNNHSSRRRSCFKFWSKLYKSSFFFKKGRSRKKDKEEEGRLRKLNVNEEYKEVFRTNSFVEIWSKVQVELETSQSPSPSPSPSTTTTTTQNRKRSSFSSTSLPLLNHHLSDCLLEPPQNVVLDSIKSSKLQSLLKDYFDVTLDAYNVCELLLRGIHKTRSNNRIIKRIINNNNKQGRCYLSNYTIQELTSFARQRNPLSFTMNGRVDFHSIHDGHATLLRKLSLRRRRIKRKQRFIKLCKNLASYGSLVAYAALAAALLALALHSVVGLLGVPGILLPFSSGVLKKVGSEKKKKAVSQVEWLGAQVDVTAKGAYILSNDFDTMGRLVARLYDEVEHRRAVAEMCVRNSKSQEVVREAMRELEVHEDGFVEQLEELEEHVYLCFLNINRSRRMVVQEVMDP